MEEAVWNRPRLPEKEIELVLQNFNKDEQKVRILSYIDGLFDNFDRHIEFMKFQNELENKISESMSLIKNK